jgi:hypothetical protein
MAIKVFGVEGERLLENHEEYETGTQDFVLISSKEFVTASPEVFLSFLEDLSSKSLDTVDGIVSAILWFFKPSELFWIPSKWQILYKAVKNAEEGQNIINPLAANYYSTTPYALGSFKKNNAVKYAVKPCYTGYEYK